MLEIKVTGDSWPQLVSNVLAVAAELAAQNHITEKVTPALTEHMAVLVQAMTKAGYPDRSEVLRAAAAAGGYLTREQAVAAAALQPGSGLKGFTRPFNRVAEELRETGAIPADLPDPLAPQYNPNISGYQRALGFRVPDEWLLPDHDEEG